MPPGRCWELWYEPEEHQRLLQDQESFIQSPSVLWAEQGSPRTLDESPSLIVQMRDDQIFPGNPFLEGVIRSRSLSAAPPLPNAITEHVSTLDPRNSRRTWYLAYGQADVESLVRDMELFQQSLSVWDVHRQEGETRGGNLILIVELEENLVFPRNEYLTGVIRSRSVSTYPELTEDIPYTPLEEERSQLVREIHNGLGIPLEELSNFGSGLRNGLINGHPLVGVLRDLPNPTPGRVSVQFPDLVRVGINEAHSTGSAISDPNNYVGDPLPVTEGLGAGITTNYSSDYVQFARIDHVHQHDNLLPQDLTQEVKNRVVQDFLENPNPYFEHQKEPVLVGSTFPVSITPRWLRPSIWVSYRKWTYGMDCDKRFQVLDVRDSKVTYICATTKNRMETPIMNFCLLFEVAPEGRTLPSRFDMILEEES